MLHRRLAALLTAVTLMAGGVAAIATATAGARTPETPTVTLSLKSTPVGKILVTNGGVIVYMFTRDKHGKNTCPASNGCAAVWPPLYGHVKLGKGVNAKLLKTVKDGKIAQLTYAGYPLYGYEYNSTSTSYVGYVQFGGAWDALTATGKVVK